MHDDTVKQTMRVLPIRFLGITESYTCHPTLQHLQCARAYRIRAAMPSTHVQSRIKMIRTSSEQSSKFSLDSIYGSKSRKPKNVSDCTCLLHPLSQAVPLFNTFRLYQRQHHTSGLLPHVLMFEKPLMLSRDLRLLAFEYKLQCNHDTEPKFRMIKRLNLKVTIQDRPQRQPYKT